jgi:hypothetical protein
MEERNQQNQDLTAKEIQSEKPLPEDAPAQGQDSPEQAEPQPQYDAFMRVIHR